MQKIQLLPNVLMLTIAALATIGGWFISLEAASQQELNLHAPVSTTLSDSIAGMTTEASQGNGVALLDRSLIHTGRSHDVILDAVGSFSGHLVVATEVLGTKTEKFAVGILQNGVVANQTQTDEEGHFSFSGLSPGVGGLFAFNDTAFLLFGVRLTSNGDSNIASNVQEFDVISSTVVAADAKLSSQIIAPGISRNELRFAGQLSAVDETFRFGVGIPATSLIKHRVQLLADGSLHGTVNCMDPRTGRLREIEDAIVYFVRDNQLIARTRVERSGEFAVSGLSAGIYSVVGAGADGAFAIAVEIIGRSDPEMSAMGSLSKLEPTSVASTLELASALVPPRDLVALYNSRLLDGLWEISDSAFPCGDIPCQGSCFGGGTGGGAAGGGAGGGGSALGLLLGGGVGYLLGADGGGGGITPASPSR